MCVLCVSVYVCMCMCVVCMCVLCVVLLIFFSWFMYLCTAEFVAFIFYI